MMMCVQTDMGSDTLTEDRRKDSVYFLEGVASEWSRVWWAPESARQYVQLNCLALEAGL